MDRMVLLNKENLKMVIECLDDLEAIEEKKELKEFKVQILKATTQIRTILGAEHWVLDKHVQLKAK